MPQVVFTAAATLDLCRLREFLDEVNTTAAQKAVARIMSVTNLLEQQPYIGRPIEDLPDQYRELVVMFGGSGYMMRYRIEADVIAVLAIRHQREASYSGQSSPL